MKIVFFGSPASAIPSFKGLVEEGHHIELVISQPDRPRGRGKKPFPLPVKKSAQELNIPCLQPERLRKDPSIVQTIEKYEPDLIVVVAYGQIIPASIIYLPKYNSINVHFSILPKYRGASPVQWALLNGERKTGITIFELNEKMDEGDILFQEEEEIFPRETSFELETRLAQKGARLLTETISCISKIEHIKQDHSKATYAPKLKKEDGKIDWTKNATFINRQIRAFNPWPSTFTFIKEKRLKITEGTYGETSTKLRSLSPGYIHTVRKEGIEVCCGENSIYLIQRLQPENKKEMDAYAFSLGTHLKPGDIFS